MKKSYGVLINNWYHSIMQSRWVGSWKSKEVKPFGYVAYLIEEDRLPFVKIILLSYLLIHRGYHLFE